jgi:hypothetical protein
VKVIIESGDDLLHGVDLQLINALEYLKLPREFVSFTNVHVHQTNGDTRPIDNFNALQCQMFLLKTSLTRSLKLAICKRAQNVRKPLAAIPNKFVRSAANVKNDLHIAEVNAGKKSVFDEREITDKQVADDEIGHVADRSEEHCCKSAIGEGRFVTLSICTD